jgi:hypothetical protein
LSQIEIGEKGLPLWRLLADGGVLKGVWIHQALVLEAFRRDRDQAGCRSGEELPQWPGFQVMIWRCGLPQLVKRQVEA